MAAALGDYLWLTSDAARPWLEALRSETSSIASAARLRKDLSAERAHLVLEQVELRARAREKFAQAERMFFTRQALEQATDERVAAFKAERFATVGQASRLPGSMEPNSTVADLCCGIGGDLGALAGVSRIMGIDLDPVAALLAEANLRSAGWMDARARVQVGDAAAFPLGEVDAWHLDPDRRADARRTTRIERYAPPLETIERMLAVNGNAAVKLAPAAEVSAAWSERAELAWLGSRGECRQQVAWFGALSRYPGRRSATVVDSLGGPRTIIGDPSESLPVADRLAAYLFEPHSAVLAARLTGALCDEHGLAAIASGIAYLTGDIPLADGALAAFEVLEVLPLDRKQLRAHCRAKGLGRLEVKKRGVTIDPERLRRQVVSRGGENEATLIVAPLGGNVRAILARRI
jgi:hypothetical protein